MAALLSNPKGLAAEFNLVGRNVLITGANRNLGRAAAKAFARAGANVAIHSRRNSDEATDAANELQTFGVRAGIVTGDISSPQAVKEMVGDAVRQVGPIDVLVNNAAIRPKRPFLEISIEELHRVFSVNLFSAYYLTFEVIRGMLERQWGRIINVSGVDGATGGYLEAHVAASKAAMIGFTKSLALEFAQKGITVNCIAPGPFRTNRNPEWFYGWESPDAWDQEHIKLMPVGRFGEPDEFGVACVFLASPAAAFMTGQTLHLNGGYYMA